MARDILDVWIHLDRIHCFDEGDGWGSAEPYLWPVFFKIDGDSVVLTEGLMLSGTATVVGTYGNHGNLNNTDVDEGEDLWIPEGLGSWSTILKPIPSQSPFREDVAGVAGVIAVLMEEDNVSDGGAVAGYNALVSAIKSGLDKVIGTLGFAKQEVTEDDIDAIKSAAQSAVKDAIKSNQGFFSNLWSWLNADDQIGSEVFRWDHDKLAESSVINFDKRWESNGDWKIYGHVNASVRCPAASVNAAKAIFEGLFGTDDMKAMRDFRDARVSRERGTAEWWELAERNAAALSWLFQTNDAARESFRAMGPAAARLLARRDAAIPNELLDQADAILAEAAKAPSRRLRIDARRARSFLALARGRTVSQALAIGAALPPARGVTKRQVATVERKFPRRAGPGRMPRRPGRPGRPPG